MIDQVLKVKTIGRGGGGANKTVIRRVCVLLARFVKLTRGSRRLSSEDCVFCFRCATVIHVFESPGVQPNGLGSWDASFYPLRMVIWYFGLPQRASTADYTSPPSTAPAAAGYRRQLSPPWHASLPSGRSQCGAATVRRPTATLHFGRQRRAAVAIARVG